MHLVVRTWYFYYCGGLGSIPSLGTRISHQATVQKKKKEHMFSILEASYVPLLDCIFSFHTPEVLTTLTFGNYFLALFMILSPM